MAGLLLASTACGKSEKPRRRGEFHRFRGGTQQPQEGGEVVQDGRDESDLDQIGALGYLAATVKAPDYSGVTIYDPERVHPGLNYYISAHAPKVTLIDMEGKVLHSWRANLLELWPDADPMVQGSAELQDFFYRSYLFENGNILAIFLGFGAVKIDKDSNVIWKYSGFTHHDIEVGPGGDIYLLTQSEVDRAIGKKKRSNLENSITILNSEGTEKQSFTLRDAYRNSEFRWALERMAKKSDKFHANTIQYITEELAASTPIAEAGDLLVSTRDNDTLIVVDPKTETIQWSITGMWRRQHHPDLLDSGNILLFDNKGGDPKFGISRAIEIDPVAQRIVWMFQGSETNHLYSGTAGTCHRLKNGNTMIVESNNGRVLEVTLEGDIVWEFISPHRLGENGELIATIDDMARVDLDYVSSWLQLSETN